MSALGDILWRREGCENFSLFSGQQVQHDIHRKGWCLSFWRFSLTSWNKIIKSSIVRHNITVLPKLYDLAGIFLWVAIAKNLSTYMRMSVLSIIWISKGLVRRHHDLVGSVSISKNTSSKKKKKLCLTLVVCKSYYPNERL